MYLEFCPFVANQPSHKHYLPSVAHSAKPMIGEQASTLFSRYSYQQTFTYDSQHSNVAQRYRHAKLLQIITAHTEHALFARCQANCVLDL
jgi:hypothetical protein